MKKVEISGVAKIDANKSSTYSSIDINGIRIEDLLTDNLFSKDKADSNGYIKESALCKVTISIEPYDEILTVNGQEMPLEL